MKSLIKVTGLVVVLVLSTPLTGASAKDTKTAASGVIVLTPSDFQLLITNFGLLTDQETQQYEKRLRDLILHSASAISELDADEEVLADPQILIEVAFLLDRINNLLLPGAYGTQSSAIYELLKLIRIHLAAAGQKTPKTGPTTPATATTATTMPPLPARTLDTPATSSGTASAASRSIYSTTTTPGGTTRSIFDQPKK